jgi:hypothetical protein
VDFIFASAFRLPRFVLISSVFLSCLGLLVFLQTGVATELVSPSTPSEFTFAASRFTESSPAASVDNIPAGTILPVLLPSISSKHAKAGDKIKGKIAQDVLLGGGAKIRAGATVLGAVVSSTSAGPGRSAILTLKFDVLVQQGKSIPIRTNLRALASLREVEDAQTPTSGPGETDVYDWLSTRQVGGDAVYGKEGLVARGSQILGKSTYQGVFLKALASEDGRCRGEVAGNNGPQAMWVFSADACGLYGLSNLEIRHAGRTEPAGEIVLESKRGAVQIPSGSGALLRVEAGE